MSSNTKITDEEHQLLVALQTRWNQLTKKFGELHYQKKGIDAEILSTDAELEQLDIDQVNIVNQIQSKYGRGQVNLATGEFISDDS